MNDIVVEFSGWIVADPYKTKFFKVGSLYSEDSGKQDTRPEQSMENSGWNLTNPSGAIMFLIM